MTDGTPVPARRRRFDCGVAGDGWVQLEFPDASHAWAETTENERETLWGLIVLATREGEELLAQCDDD